MGIAVRMNRIATWLNVSLRSADGGLPGNKVCVFNMHPAV